MSSTTALQPLDPLADRIAAKRRERAAQSQVRQETDLTFRARQAFDRPLFERVQNVIRDERSQVQQEIGSRVSLRFNRQRLSEIGVAEDEEGFPVLQDVGKLGKIKDISFGIEDPVRGISTVRPSSERLNERIDLLRKRHEGLLQEIEDKGNVVDIPTRFFGNVKLTFQGMLGLLEEKFGAGNVLPVFGESGLDQIMILQTGGDPMIWDERSLSFRGFAADFVDVLPDLLEATPGAVGSAVALRSTGDPATSAAVGAGLDTAANLIRQGADAALPGPSLNEVAGIGGNVLSLGTAVGAGLVGEGLVAGGREIFRAQGIPTGPVDFLGKRIAKDPVVSGEVAVDTAAGTITRGGVSEVPTRIAASEGEKIAEEVGIPLTLGQKSLSTVIGRVEDTLRRLPGSDRVFAAFNDKQLKASVKAVDRVVDTNLARIAPDNAFAAAKRAVAAYSNHRGKLIKIMRDGGAEDFGRLQSIVGDQPIFRLDNLLGAADDLAKGAGTGASKAAKRAAKLADEIRRDASEGGLLWSTRQVQDRLADWGEAAATAKKPVARRFFTVLKTALERDIDDLIAANPATREAGQEAGQALATTGPSRTLPGGGGVREGVGEFVDALPREAALALKEARRNYAARGAVVEASSSSMANKLLSTLAKKSKSGRISGDITGDDLAGGSAVIKAVLSEDSDVVRHLMGALREADPVATRQLERGVLEELIRRSAPGEGTELGLREIPFSPRKLAQNIRTNLPRLRAMASGSTEASEAVRQLDQLSVALKRSTRGVAEGSQTAGRLGLMELISNTTSLAIARDLGGAAEQAALLLRGDRLARIFTDPDKSRAFVQLMNPPASWSTATFGRALTNLTADLLQDEELDPSEAVKTLGSKKRNE